MQCCKYSKPIIDKKLDGIKTIYQIAQDKKTASEYDMLKSLRKYSKAELRKMGYSKEAIESIKKPLKAKGKYGGLTYTISWSSMRLKNGSTYVDTKMTWKWSRAPVSLCTDIAEIATGADFKADSAGSKVQYYTYGDKKKKSIVKHPAVKTKKSMSIAFIRIDMGRDWNSSEHAYRNVALSVQMEVTWRVKEKWRSVGLSSNYGHFIMTGPPSVYYDTFTPAWKCRSGDEAYVMARL
jgi:hypothetical protein